MSEPDSSLGRLRESWRRILGHQVEEMIERDNVKVTLAECASDDDGIPETLTGWIEWLQMLAHVVPDEFRDNVTVEIEYGYDSDDDRGVWIGYWRKETDAEFEKRKREIARLERVRTTETAARERQTYERLKAKFEGKP